MKHPGWHLNQKTYPLFSRHELFNTNNHEKSNPRNNQDAPERAQVQEDANQG